MQHPYETFPDRNYWNKSVGFRGYTEISGLWTPKFKISKKDQTITAGSCFAQHMSKAMREAGFRWLNCEPAPKYLYPDQAKTFNYGVYSFRTSNIYTARALRQWMNWAEDRGESIMDRHWSDGERFFDPFRPTIEPGGFCSLIELEASRQTVLRAIRQAIRKADLFVFTLGLTESWAHKETGEVYAVCPGTAAGTFDKTQHVFTNADYPSILEDMEFVIEFIRRINPKIRFLLTVSPVPLVATASDQHVLPATIYSKSVLRAVAGKLEQTFPFVDYFPSYEIVSAFPFKGDFFKENLRFVTPEGVAFVMQHFIGALIHGETESSSPPTESKPVDMDEDDTVVCEEMFLDKK